MGHRFLGELPQTRNWLKVIDTLKATDNPAMIADATSKAAQRGLNLASKDKGVSNVIFMLMNIVWSSRKDDFIKAISDLGISISETSSLLDLVANFDDVLDKNLRRTGHRTDLAEMARLSAVDAFIDICKKETGNLFGVTSNETQQTLKKYTSPERFGAVGQKFFGNFLYRFLDYHLSRELPNHIGPDKQFTNANSCEEFKSALALHCHQTSRIVKEFAGCWPSATEYREGINADNVRTKFLPVALKKIRKELKQREGN